MSLIALAQALIDGPADKTEKLTIRRSDSVSTRDDNVLSFEAQFWPESIQESISVQWVDKVVAGGSHPLKQWVSNGGRTISFSLLLGRDSRPGSDGASHDALPQGNLLDPQSEAYRSHNPDIRQKLMQLRWFAYPTYKDSGGDSGVTIAQPPPVLDVYAGGIGWGNSGDGLFTGVLTNLSINYQRAFAQGTPRLVTVDLSFAEVVQADAGINFIDREQFATLFTTTDADT